MQGQDWHPRCSSLNLSNGAFHRATMQSPKTTGKENLVLTVLACHEAISEGMCVALVREQRFGRCCLILALRSGICTYSPQTTFLENIWTFLTTTAPCEGSEMAVKFVSLGNSWFVDWRTGFLVYRQPQGCQLCAKSTQLHSCIGRATRHVLHGFISEREMLLVRLCQFKKQEEWPSTFPNSCPMYHKYDSYTPATDYTHHELWWIESP